LTRALAAARIDGIEREDNMRSAFVAAALAWAATLTVAHAQDAPAGSAERGQKIFQHQLCFNCHGTVGQGGGVAGPKIAPQPFPWPAFAQQVRTPRQGMPPYTTKNLPDQDLADIYAYLLSIKPGARAADIPLLSGK
jgi:ubiquinol-cytochrome c reductase cytochrome c subunit